MLVCYDEGLWQAYLDAELEQREIEAMKEHLQTCAACSEILSQIRSAQNLTAAALGKYEGEMKKIRYNPALGWERFQRRTSADKFGRKGWFDMSNVFQKRIAAVAAVTIIAGSLAFAPVRSMAAQFLQVFRAEKLATVSISVSELQEIRAAVEKGAGTVDLDIFGKIEFEGRKEIRKAPLADIKNEAGFAVREPAWLPEDYALAEAQMTLPFAVRFDLDVPKVNQLITTLGGVKMLPEDVAGKSFSLAFPEIVSIAYHKGDGAAITVSQGKSPEVSVDEGVDVRELRAAVLDLPIISDSLKRQIAQVEDWEHTLIVPNVEGTTQEVAVKGNKGVFVDNGPAAQVKARVKEGARSEVASGSVTLQSDDLIVEGGSGGYNTTLIWNENGLVYSLSGAKDLDTALKIAESMR